MPGSEPMQSGLFNAELSCLALSRAGERARKWEVGRPGLGGGSHRVTAAPHLPRPSGRLCTSDERLTRPSFAKRHSVVLAKTAF